ncbi:hypothetical protein PV10_04831 [Exophiala mesophila]|uniref:DUF7905 domain-containing protein n=2 Tax=Exophiala mesophila TaxID=212818 RepID=A0A0D1XZE9_EXOME|nr:uncharacterized protein PV10_04831 [Exophiala mesophila]KIV93631.1 hypothetical protein PV10_04831 [Exophiala mesophila]
MSDHEGEGLDLDKWDNASLPGSVYSFGASTVRGTGLYSHQASNPSHLSLQRDPSRQNTESATTQPRNQPYGHHPIRTSHGLYGRSLPETAALRQFQRHDPPADRYQLGLVWNRLCMMALRADLGAAMVHPRAKLREIMISTSTFLKEPLRESTEILIWGDQDQVAKAKEALREFEVHTRSAPKAKSDAWARSNALDGRAEHRQARAEQQRELHDVLLRENFEFPIEAYILWPQDLDMDVFIAKHMTTIEEFQKEFFCRITLTQSKHKRLDIGAQKREHLDIIFRRLTNLVREMVAHRDQLVKVNLIHHPSSKTYLDQVRLDKDVVTNLFLPTLFGNPTTRAEEWDSLQDEKRSRERRKTRKALEECIKGLRVSQCHVRMRVVFGELGFSRFQKPVNGTDGYSFDDFSRMLTDSRTKVLLNSLPGRQGDGMLLADAISSLGAFKDPVMTYGAFFDFQPSKGAFDRLRLECISSEVREDPNDLEVQQQRWITYGEMVQRLQVSIFDFEAPDYQITLDAFPLHDDKRVSQDMKSFQNTVEFTPSAGGMKSSPVRRVRFKPRRTALESVSDITVMRWRFKDTDGIFELRRKDTFDTEGGALPREPSKWHAFYYYQEWDNLMSELASARPGEEVSWGKSVATFFPENGEDEGLALPKGFQSFMDEVEDVQRLLAEAISKLANEP